MTAFSMRFGLQEYMEIFGGGKTKASKEFNDLVKKSGKTKQNFTAEDVANLKNIRFRNLLAVLNAGHKDIKDLLDATDNMDEKIKIINAIDLNKTTEVIPPLNPVTKEIPYEKKTIPYIKKEKKVKEKESEYDKRIRLKYTDDKYFEKKMKEANRKRKGKF